MLKNEWDVHIMWLITSYVFLYPVIGPAFSANNASPVDDEDDSIHPNSPSHRQSEYERIGGRAGSS